MKKIIIIILILGVIFVLGNTNYALEQSNQESNYNWRVHKALTIEVSDDWAGASIFIDGISHKISSNKIYLPIDSDIMVCKGINNITAKCEDLIVKFNLRGVQH